MSKAIAIFLSLLLLVSSTGSVAQDNSALPATAPLALTGRVVDAAQVVGAEPEQAMSGVLASLEQDLGVQFVVVSTPSLQGQSIGDYARALGNGWRQADPPRNIGLLLVVAPNDRQARIEVGTGLRPVLSEEFCEQVIALMVPSFRDGQYADGMMIAVLSLDARLRKIAAEATG